MESKEYKVMYEVEDNHFWYKGMRAITKVLLDKSLNKKKNNTILDAGCGTGANIIFLNKYGKTQGFDISIKAIDFCKKRGLKNVKVGSITDIKSKNKTYDLVTCFDVLGQMEVKSEKKAIQEFYRVLKPGGTLLLRIAAYNWMRGYHDKQVHAKHRYTISELKELLEVNKFEILRATYANTLLFPFVLLRRFVLDKLFPKKNVTDSDVQEVNPFLNKILLLFLLIESAVIKHDNFLFGLSVIVVARK